MTWDEEEMDAAEREIHETIRRAKAYNALFDAVREVRDGCHKLAHHPGINKEAQSAYESDEQSLTRILVAALSVAIAAGCEGWKKED